MKTKRNSLVHGWWLLMLPLFFLFVCIPLSAKTVQPKDGSYQVEVELSGGSGRATITSPCKVEVKDGVSYATIEWSSNHYDYMVVDGEKLLPVNTEGNSQFLMKISSYDEPIDVIADTTAMSTPHEIDYQLTFHSDGLNKGSNISYLLIIICIILVFALFIFFIIRKKKHSAAGKTFLLMLLPCFLILSVCGCSGSQTQSDEKTTEKAVDPSSISKELTYTDSMELTYATQFSVDYYEDGYALITIHSTDEDQYLLVPEGREAPSDLSSDIVVLKQPLNHVYLVASAVMDMYAAFDGVGDLAFCGMKEDEWYIEKAKTAMQQGTLKYAGKYSAPDYETIVAGGCNLAIENTMIYHTPEVKEELEKFGIPVLVDNSSYESNPLGRTEWVKLYGLLSGKEDAAVAAFDAQVEEFSKIKDEPDTGKTVAFFYITSDGQANVRKSGDYLAKMIKMAGGNYIFSDLGDEDDTASSTMSMTMEEFYASAVDADYIIYNSTIEGQINSVDELLSKSEFLANFKAVKKGNVYCTSKNLYQSSMELGTIITDIYHMLHDQPDQMTYLYKIS